MQVWLGRTLQKLDALLLGVCQEFKEDGYITVSVYVLSFFIWLVFPPFFLGFVCVFLILFHLYISFINTFFLYNPPPQKKNQYLIYVVLTVVCTRRYLVLYYWKYILNDVNVKRWCR